MQYVPVDASGMGWGLQMLVDCSYSQKDGCTGGWPTAAWDYMKANQGVASESVRPFTSSMHFPPPLPSPPLPPSPSHNEPQADLAFCCIQKAMHTCRSNVPAHPTLLHTSFNTRVAR